MIPISEPVETAELLAFARTIEAKSIAQAALELGIPRATLSRRLARLEERLGTRLIRRNSRSLSPTDAGKNFYRHARVALDAVAQAEASVRMASEAMRGDLRVTVPAMGVTRGAEESFHQLVTSFLAKHPDVRLQVEFSTRVADLQREGYDVALRAAYELQPGLVARTIARDKVIAVASPEYLAQNGTPSAVKDLRSHRCLTCFARGEHPQATWPTGDGATHIESAFASNDLGLLREVAVRGLGIALLPKLIVAELLDSAALVHVLPGIVEAEHHVAVVYPEREFLPAHVRAFVQRLVEWAPTLHRTAAEKKARPSDRNARAKPARL